ncbi:D-arabinitol 2-dehydrogenase [ribulose-forming] [Lachnellula cervina]|uniref:D-arabinitol 2-dehydrogenase [ribulose-forming] n=1 Tax=Lachnellula cervina TaxID=1316786 RepID=A0A7D8YUA9_9HELO|nr:D-arabinitol 2-dehydrogenase [ribulose-forming] [Lachnellula cervina]
MGSIEAQVVSDITLPNHIPESAQTPSQAPVPRLFSLEGRTIAITGAGRGVGINLAAAVLEAGGHAACIDVLPEPSPVEWASLQKLAKSSNLTISYHKCDITSEESISGTLDTIAKEALEVKAPLHGTIACAGIQQKAPAVDYPIDGFRRIMEVNVTGTFLTIKHSARIFMEQKIPGSIVMIASMSGQVANRGLTCTAYNSSKAAVHQMCRSVAQEWGQHGIRVNTISPGYIRTAMTDELLASEPALEKTWMAGALLGRLGAPEDFKAPTVFLLADGSSWMTGADLRVDGGHCASA